MKQTLRNGLVVGLLCIGSSIGSVSAAPTITSVAGSFSHGASVTIIGSGFGTKNPATPVLWADFESGTLGQTVENYVPTYGPNLDLHNIGGSQLPGTFSNTNVRHARSTKHAYLDANPNQGNWAIRLGVPISSTNGQKLYYRFWHKSFFADGIPGANLNQKPVDIYNSGFTDQLYIGYGDASGQLRSGGSASSPTQWASISISNVHNQWAGYEEEVRLGSGSNGSRKMWVHRQSVPTITQAWNAQSMSTWKSGGDYAWFTVGEYFAGGSVGVEYWIDEIYVDYTWARVEIGNAPTWSGCTRREIQIPSAWSDTSITVTVNQGALQSLGSAFLYVVDANGNVNQNGYALCTACPMPPVLNVQ